MYMGRATRVSWRDGRIGLKASVDVRRACQFLALRTFRSGPAQNVAVFHNTVIFLPGFSINPTFAIGSPSTTSNPELAGLRIARPR